MKRLFLLHIPEDISDEEQTKIQRQWESQLKACGIDAVVGILTNGWRLEEVTPSAVYQQMNQ